MKYLKKLLILISILASILISEVYAKTIHIVNFNDFHSMMYYDKDKDLPGMVFFMNAILSEFKKHGKDNVILVSGGDNYQGSIVSYDTKGSPISDMFRELGVAFSAVGNHEFDWGQRLFEEWQKDGNFLFLAANIIDKETGKNPLWITPYKIIKINGVKVAFIGLSTLETSTATNATNLKGLKIIDPWISAQYWIDYLKTGKDKEGIPDVIVALTHIPSIQDKFTGKIMAEEINNLCLKTRGLNIVISGHSHQTVCGKIDGVSVVQAECNGKKYGVIKVEIDDTTGEISKIESKVCDVPVDVELLPENRGENILAKYSNIKRKFFEIIGRAETSLPYDVQSENALGVYITKTMAESTKSQIAFVSGSDIRCGLNKGDITVSDIFTIYPFDFNLVSMRLSGNAVKAVLEHGLGICIKNSPGCVQFYGLKVMFDSSKPVGKRVISMTLNDGQEIKIGDYYSVCVYDFLFFGGDNYKFEGAIDVKEHHDLFVREVIIERLKKERVLIVPEANCLIDLANKKRVSMIDYKNLADAETKIWQSYYKRDSDALLKNMKVFIIGQYGITDSEKAEEVAKKLVLGYKTFAAMPQLANPKEYDTGVLPLLVAAYQALKQSINASWDSQKVAVADLSWMVARRQDSTFDPEIVAKKMAVLFGILYGQQENHHFIRAAYLRSVAGRYRDQCQDAWGGVTSEDWKVVNSLLKNAYKELYQGLKTSQRKFLLSREITK